MNALFRCKVGHGMFSGEIAVRGAAADGEEFSLFVPKEFVRYGQPLEDSTNVDGLLRVKVLAEEAGRYLIQLPGEAFENGRTVTVGAGQLEQVPVDA